VLIQQALAAAIGQAASGPANVVRGLPPATDPATITSDPATTTATTATASPILSIAVETTKGYFYDYDNDLAPAVLAQYKYLPLTEFATAVALVEYATKAISIVTGFVSNIWDDVVGFFDKGTPLEAYKRIVPRTYHPDLRLGILTSPTTLDDAAFAEQRLSGLHPLMVTAITWAKVAQAYGVAEAIVAAVTLMATTAGAAELEPTTAQYYECNWSQYFASAAAQLNTSKYGYGCRALCRGPRRPSSSCPWPLSWASRW
jgi:hypothetical protein